MKNPKCEVFINFMVGPINRWALDPSKADALNNLFGTNEWKNLIKIENGLERITAYADLYENQLKNVARIKFVRRFLMINKFNQPLYFLFFGTNKDLGLKVMKRVMWNTNLNNGNCFSDRTDPNQTVLFELEPNYELLRNALLDKYGGKEVSIYEIEKFVLIETAYMPDRHLIKPVLIPLEDEGRILVRPLSKSKSRRKHTFKNCYIKFN